MLRGDIRRRALNALSDDAQAPVFFDTGRMNQSIDEGFERLVEMVPAVRKTLYVPRREGQMLYSIGGLGETPAAMQAPWRLWLPDLTRRLIPVELNDLDARHELWLTIQGDPYWWFPVDWRTFGIWPTPGPGGGLIQIDYYAWPAPMTDDRDPVLDLPLEDEVLLAAYAECEGYLRQWDVASALRRWQFLVGNIGDAVANADLETYHARDYARSTRQSPLHRDEPYGAR